MLPGKEYTPADYVAMALRWRWVVVACFAVGVYGALVVSSRMPDVYQSEMLIQVVPQRVPTSFVPSAVAMRTVDRLSALTEQILSRPELQRLIEEMELFPKQRARLPMQDVVELMRGQIQIEPVLNRGTQDADSFYVRFQYTDPQTARQVTERLGGLFINANAKDRGDLAQDTYEFLEASRADALRKMEETEARLEAFRERYAGRLPNQVGSNEQSLRSAQTQLQSVLDSIARDRDDKAMAERQYAEIEAQIVPTAATSGSATGAGSDPTAGSTAEQLARARDALAQLELRLTPVHPDITRTKGLISRLEAQLKEEQAAAEQLRRLADENGETDALALASLGSQELARQNRLRDTRNQIDRLNRDMDRKENEATDLRAQIAEYQRRIEQAPSLDSEYTRLTRDYETQKKEYESLLAKANQAQLSTQLEERQIGEQFRVLDPARTPVRPLGINRLQLNMGGAVAGLGIGLLVALLLELKDRSFRRAEEIVEVLKLPVIALVPRVLSDADQRRLRTQRHALVTLAVAAAIAGSYGFWAMELWKYVA